MGGDYGPSVVVPAALQTLVRHPALHLILVGDEPVLRQHASSSPTNHRLTIRHASQQVNMDEEPSQALRFKKDSSMRVAIDLVKSGEAHACVSAGNTGALMATARFVLKMIAGIDRPAIVSTFPTRNGGHMRMLDLGANVDSTAEHLHQFAVMGSVLASAIDNIHNPSVCLLNIGIEAIKGNELVKQTAQLLEKSQLNYKGYIEGDHLYDGKTDVIVCDGFVGNVALKVSEGVAIYIRDTIQETFRSSFFSKVAALMTFPILKSLMKRMDPDRYNGACLLGLQGVVIKSHGSAKINAFSYAIEEAMRQAEKNIPHRIRAEVEQLMKSASS